MEDNLMELIDYYPTSNELVDEYTFWCKAQGLKCVDAMELIHEGKLTRHQNAWVVQFIERWEEAWDRETEAEDEELQDLEARERELDAEDAALQECWHREGGE